MASCPNSPTIPPRSPFAYFSERVRGCLKRSQTQANLSQRNESSQSEEENILVIPTSNASNYAALPKYPTVLNDEFGYVGSAIIFNFQNFPNSPKLEFRSGSDKDVCLLKDLLDRAQMKTTIHNDLSKVDMLKELNTFAKSEDHRHGCVAFIFILSHGNETCIAASDGELVYLEAEVYPIFYHDNCKELIGKPKNFVIQSCRGKKEQIGTAKDSISGKYDLIPNVSDISIVYASIPFYSAYRNVSGSWLITSYTEVLGALNEMDYEDREYKRLLMRVSQSINEKTSFLGKKTTIDITYRGFDSLLYMPELLTTEELRKKEQVKREAFRKQEQENRRSWSQKFEEFISSWKP